MARVLTSINMEMLRDGYNHSDVLVYSLLWNKFVSAKEDKWTDTKYPSIQQMANYLVLSKKAVINSLKKLENDNLIEIYKGGYKVKNTYDIIDEYKYPCRMDYFNGEETTPYATR